jgi:hypothetical protein
MADLPHIQIRNGDIVDRKARADKRCVIARFAAAAQTRGVVSNEGCAGVACRVAALNPITRRNQ